MARPVRVGACVCALLVAASAPASAQEAAAERPPAAVPGSAPKDQPGFVDAFGRWWQDGAARFRAGWQGAQEKLDQLGKQARESTKDATNAVVGLPNSRVVIARELCPTAANGAPDCQTAAATLCRGKGFQSGQLMDTQSEQKCNSARFLLEGRAPSGTECPTQMFVTRAVCQ
jgi:hypothetical protein